MNRFLELSFFVFFAISGCISSNNSPSSKDNDLAPTIESAAVASENGEWLKAAQFYEQLYLKDLSNESLNYETGTNYLKANAPQKALAILNSFDKKYQDKAAEFNGRIARIAKAYYQIGAYDKIEEVVENYEYPKMYRGLAREHLKALIQQQKLTDLSICFEQYQQKGIYDDKGKKTNTGFLYRAICNELLLIGRTDLLKKYAAAYYEWAIKRQAKDQRNLAISVFYQQDFTKAIPFLERAIANEKSARHRMELTGLLGICYAQHGDSTKALEQIGIIQNFDLLPNRHDAFGAKFYHQARIEVALKQYEKAIKSLKNALAAKAEFWSNRFYEDGLLRDLFEEEGFQELVRMILYGVKLNLKFTG